MTEASAGLRIRDAGAEDRAAVEAVTLAAYEQYSAILPAPLWAAYRENMLSALAEAPPGVVVVAESGGRVVGSVLLYPAGTAMTEPGTNRVRPLPEPEVRLLAVPPAGRGRGVGRRLMEECIRRARSAGAGTLTLHTTDMMQVAMALYARMGFRRAPEIDFQPAPGVLVKGYRLAV